MEEYFQDFERTKLIRLGGALGVGACVLAIAAAGYGSFKFMDYMGEQDKFADINKVIAFVIKALIVITVLLIFAGLGTGAYFSSILIFSDPKHRMYLLGGIVTIAFVIGGIFVAVKRSRLPPVEDK